LRDPRVERTREHLLEEILLMAIAAILSGANGWNEIEDYAQSKVEWFESFLRLPGGIPWHDTFNRVFSALDPDELEKGFVAWVSSIARLTAREVGGDFYQILPNDTDGSVLIVVGDVTGKGLQAGMLAALIVGAIRTSADTSSDPLQVLQTLNKRLCGRGHAHATCLALRIAAKIVEKKADYILAVKENRGHLLEEIEDSFQRLAADAVAEEIDCGHGRVERRTCAAIADLSLLEKASEWASLQGLVRIRAERYHKATGKTEREIRYYIISLRPDAERLNASIRQHWGIENKLHWVLDVGFREDLDRKRAGHAAQNFSVLNRIALKLLKQDKTSKRGVHGKRLKAGWDNDYLLHLPRN
jgi:predicted transposase YbfD/YdcC